MRRFAARLRYKFKAKSIQVEIHVRKSEYLCPKVLAPSKLVANEWKQVLLEEFWVNVVL